MPKTGQRVASAYVELGGDPSGALKAMNQVSGGLEKTKKEASSFKTTAASMFAGMMGAQLATKALGVLTSTITSSIAAASDLNETTSKTKVIFGDSADLIIDKSGKMAEAAGLSSQAYMDAAATFGVFGKSAGLAGDDLAGFSDQMVVLSADMASFSNTTPEDAILAIGAALRGESEPIRRYGVLLDDATLRQKAMELGIISTTKNALTPQQRVLAAQASILEQTSDAQGDFMRTSDGLANQQRILKAEIDNAKVAIGTGLLPATIAITSAGVDFIQVLTGTYDATQHAKDGISDLDNAMTKLNTAFLAGSAQVQYQKLVEDGVITNERNIQVQKKVFDAFWDNEKLLKIYNNEINGYINYSAGVIRQDEIRRAGIKKLSAVIPGIKDNTDKWTFSERKNSDALWDNFNAANGLTGGLEKLTLAEKNAKDAAQELTDNGISYLNTTINSQLGPELEDFILAQSDLEGAMGDVNIAIQEAILKYGDQSEQVLTLRDDYAELKGQYTDNEKEHDRASKEIMFDLLEQSLALGGYTDAERLALEATAKAWGLPYQATVDYLAKVKDVNDYIAYGGDPALIADILTGQKTLWEALRDSAALAEGEARGYNKQISQMHDVNVTVTTTYVNAGAMAPGGAPPGEGYVWNGHDWVYGGANGLDMIVPPGFDHDSYPVRAESGERVIVIPKGQAGNSTIYNNFNMEVHTNAQDATVMRDYNRMKAMVS